ncbi:MAG: segregation/condensation protein A [Myxococcota bacterium]
MTESDPEARGITLVAPDGAAEPGAVGEAVESSGMGYAVKLPIFEGPLDLLLHLIRQNDLDIADIPVAEVSSQYLEYLELMQELNLDIAGEYLVMAATLALIKSRILLPAEPGEGEEEADPRAELVARLLEYQRFKEVAESLSRRRLLGRDVFEARGSEPERRPESEREIEVGLFELLTTFREVLASADQPPEVHDVEAEVFTVRERMLELAGMFERHDTLEFMRVFDTPAGESPSRPLLVATFLAVLELVRMGMFRVYQGSNEAGAPEGPIRLRRASAEGAEVWASRIAELM